MIKKSFPKEIQTKDNYTHNSKFLKILLFVFFSLFILAIINEEFYNSFSIINLIKDLIYKFLPNWILHNLGDLYYLFPTWFRAIINFTGSFFVIFLYFYEQIIILKKLL